MKSMLMPPSTTNDTVLEFDQRESEADKYITFKLADYLFALPSDKILKVVPTPTPSQGGMVSMGLVQLEQYSIQMLDLPKMMNLHQREAGDRSLGLDNLASPSDGDAAPEDDVHSFVETGTAQNQQVALKQYKNPPFLMVLQDAAGDLWGIAVHEPPDLMDIPHYALKPVPSEKRLTRTLRWVSHVVTFDLDGDRHTLLVLDLSVLLSTQATPTPEESLLLEIAPPFVEAPLADLAADNPAEDGSPETLLGIEPPLELTDLEVVELAPDSTTHEESGRQEEMYA